MVRISVSGSQFNAIVHRFIQLLLASYVAFRGLHRDMPEQKLNLLQLSTRVVAQACTAPTQIVWGESVDPGALGTFLYDVPHNILRHT